MNVGKLKSFLDKVCVNNVVVTFQSESIEKFCSVVHLYLQFGGEDCDLCCSKFIRKFSSETQTKWMSFQKFEGKYIYRHIYVCYLSKRNTTEASQGTVRQNYCKAKIDFQRTYTNRYSSEFGKHFKTGLCVVRIDFDHNHDLSPDVAVSPSRGVEEDFCSYLRSEISPIAAKSVNEVPLATHENNDSAPPGHVKAQTNPSDRQVINLYNYWEKAHHKPVGSTLQALLVKKQQLENNGYYLSIKEETLDVAVISPIMKRVFEEFSTRDSVVFIESTESHSLSERSCGKNNDLSLTFAFVSSKIGALPVACVLQTSHNIQKSLSLLKVSLERVSRSPFNPRVVVTNGSTLQIIALKTIFPKSKILLSVSHIRQNAWKWLSDPANNLPVVDKDPIMKNFHKFLLAPSIDLANAAFKELFKVLSSKVKDNLRITNYFESWWSRRSEMAFQFHIHEIVPEDINIDDCEESIRLLKSTLLYKAKGFSSLALLDLVCNVIEDYYHRRLSYFASGRDDRVTYHFSEFCQTVPEAVIMVSSEGEYKLRCGQHLYTVNTDLSVCDCTSSREGLYCEHLATADHKFNLWAVKQPPVLSEHERAVLARIVSGADKSEECGKTKQQVLEFENVNVKNKPEEQCTKSLESGKVKLKLDEGLRGNSENAEVSVKLDENCIDNAEIKMEYELEDCTGNLESDEGRYTPYDDLIGCYEMAEIKSEPEEPIIDHSKSAEEAIFSSIGLGEETCIKKGEVNVMNNQEIFSNIRKELNRVADLFELSDTGSASALLHICQLLQDVRTPEEAHQLVVSITQQNS